MVTRTDDPRSWSDVRVTFTVLVLPGAMQGFGIGEESHSFELVFNLCMFSTTSLCTAFRAVIKP